MLDFSKLRTAEQIMALQPGVSGGACLQCHEHDEVVRKLRNQTMLNHPAFMRGFRQRAQELKAEKCPKKMIP